MTSELDELKRLALAAIRCKPSDGKVVGIDMLQAEYDFHLTCHPATILSLIEQVEVVRFQSAVSGLWYKSALAAGDVSAIRVGNTVYLVADTESETED